MRFFVSMRLIINGEMREDLEAATIEELLSQLKIEPGRVAVEVNMKVVKKADYVNFGLHDGDTIEIVNFVAGG
jgi:sulfur carrier protein